VFSGVALGFTFALQNAPGLRNTPATIHPPREQTSENLPAVYLLPFLSILAAAMISRAVSARFEWLYPLRFFAAAFVIWHYRRRYTRLDWGFGWLAALVGTLAFLMWLGLDLFAAPEPSSETAASLSGLPSAASVTWIICRVLAATITVPIAEELAFRGFLLRRLVSANFETVQASCFTPFAILASSFAFGALHGSRWLAGTLAGLLYAYTFRRRGRIGDAVAAHAITNTLLAAWVLFTGSFQLW
jgi:CAAX prenyl protease-like protein